MRERPRKKMLGECLAIYPFKEYSNPFHPTSRRLLLLSPEDSVPHKLIFL